jgi:PAS domain S-box-containing protein
VLVVGRAIRYRRGVVDAPYTVVLVDDAPEVRALVRAQLKRGGRFTIVGEAATGAQAIEVSREQLPDLVLLDISMPDMDGFAALPEIRKVAGRSRIVIYTGFEERGLEIRARELGADALVEKSIEIGLLANRLEAILQDTVAPNAAHEDLPALGDGVDTTVLDEHLERFREVVEEAAIGIATMTLTGRIVRANKALAGLVGRSVDDLVGVPYLSLAAESATDAITEALQRAQADRGTVVQFEHFLGGAAAGRLVAVTAVPVREARDRPLYLSVQIQDVTAQRQAEEELRASEQRFRLLVETVRDYAIFMLDPDGRVASWNAGAERIKGYRGAEIIGRHFRVFYPSEVQAAGHPEHNLEVALEEGSYEEEGWRLRKDGSRFWASVVITAIHRPTGEHIGFAKVTRDIEERRQLLLDAERSAAELAVANAELEVANKRLLRDAADQAQFLAVTAHELRSPVSVMSGSAQLLVEHWDELEPDERAELASSMSSSATRLQRLLSDLRTASRLEARAVELHAQPVDMADVLHRAVVAAHAAAPDSTIELDTSSNLWVVGDADRLAQVIDNLLENARVHGDPPVVVRGRRIDTRVTVQVVDHGRGVAADLRDRLFSRFATGSPRGGTGLGLYIVRELARSHGGEAGYEPTPGGGATFVLTLPARGAPAH